MNTIQKMILTAAILGIFTTQSTCAENSAQPSELSPIAYKALNSAFPGLYPSGAPSLPISEDIPKFGKNGGE